MMLPRDREKIHIYNIVRHLIMDTHTELEINKGKTKGVPMLSPESVTFAFVLIFLLRDHNQLAIDFSQAILTFQDPRVLLEEVDKAVKKQLVPAVQITCMLPLLEKLLSERTSRSRIAFMYIIARTLCRQSGMTKLDRATAIQLWEAIWTIAIRAPLIEEEWKEAEERNDLKGWKQNIQIHAKEKWKHFSKNQLPRAEQLTKDYHEKMQEFLNFTA